MPPGGHFGGPDPEVRVPSPRSEPTTSCNRDAGAAEFSGRECRMRDPCSRGTDRFRADVSAVWSPVLIAILPSSRIVFQTEVYLTVRRKVRTILLGTGGNYGNGKLDQVGQRPQHRLGGLIPLSLSITIASIRQPPEIRSTQVGKRSVPCLPVRHNRCNSYEHARQCAQAHQPATGRAPGTQVGSHKSNLANKAPMGEQ